MFRFVFLVINICRKRNFGAKVVDKLTCKWANSWLRMWGIWSFSMKKVRASEQCLNWSGVRGSLGGEPGEKAEFAVEEVAAMADLLRWWWPRLEMWFPSSVFLGWVRWCCVIRFWGFCLLPWPPNGFWLAFGGFISQAQL